MKKFNLLTLMVMASLAVNGMGIQNSCLAASDDSDGSEPFDISRLGIRGDMNSDGIISVLDLVRYKKYLLGGDISLPSDYQSDINSDGQKNVCDFVMLKGAILGNVKIWSPKNMPVMDGSTSAIPLETGFKSRMLGISYTDAKSIVKHHKTHESFQMLLSGENDMIFTVPISESQQKDADDAGVHLNFKPVAREGFVFVVNKSNPVDHLTQQQIQDIYSGKITNWSDVGGNDEEIIAYQRNNDSGSQNYMTEFMKNSQLIDAPKDYRLGSMGALMDGIAVYDNAQNAIGYSVYSYAAQMYENSSDVKFIAVDGVKPSRESMADGTYPLLSNTFILYTDNASQDTLDFADWAVSDEGQECVLENGYVPVADIEYPERLRSYNSKGTGKEKPADYKPSVKKSEFSQYLSQNSDDRFQMDFLKDKEYQKEINNDINKEAEKFSTPEVSAEIINGYMSVTITDPEPSVAFLHEFGKPAYKKVSVLNYDLINKKKIENFSDLFYKDVNFISTVNDTVASDINTISSEYIRTDFLGLTGSIDNYSINSLYLDSDNPYLTYTFKLNYNSYYLPDYMVTGQYYNVSALLDDRYTSNDIYYGQWNIINYKDTDGEYRQKVEGSRFHSDSEVEEHRKVYEKIFSKGLEIRSRDEMAKDQRIIISEPCNDDFCSSPDVLYVTLGKLEAYYGPYMFDPDTGEQIFISDIIGEEFADYDNKYVDITSIDLESSKVELYTYETGKYKMFDLNPDHVNMKYIYQMPHTAELTEFETPLTGETKYLSGLYGYASSYILEYGPKKTQWPIEGNWHVTAKRKCYSHGVCWYECWDTDDNDYYGWINGINIKFYN